MFSHTPGTYPLDDSNTPVAITKNISRKYWISSGGPNSCSWELLILFYKWWLIKYCSLSKLWHTIIQLSFHPNFVPTELIVALCEHVFILYVNSLTVLQNASWCVLDNQLIHQFNFPCGCLCPPALIRTGCSLSLKYNSHLATSHTKNFLCLTSLIKPVSGFTCVGINCTWLL